MRKSSALTALALLAGACTATEPAPRDRDDVAPGTLALDVGDTRVLGTFEATDGQVLLGGEVIGTSVYDLWVEVHGMHLSLLVDFDAGVMEWDGYTADDGTPTQMTDEDRATLLELYVAMDALGNDNDLLAFLRRKVGNWAEMSDTFDLTWQKLYDDERSVTSLCGSCGSWVTATHDCNHGSTGSDATSAKGLIKYEGALCGGDGSAYGTTSSTSCSGEPAGFATIEYFRGNCVGRCGPGCSSSDTQFTKDCLNHDSCTRGGHALASAYCDDQLTSCADDDASPSVGGGAHCGTGC